MLTVENLIFEYPRFRALKDVSFTLKENAITAVVGPNGAGKTTLFKCLAGLSRPLNGTILLHGLDVINFPRESHSKIGFLPDFFGLYQNLTVYQCLHYFAEAYDMPAEKIEEAIATTLRRIRLEDKAEATTAELSRGMRQRLAIGQAIIHSPQLLLLDEPASGLDPEARLQLGELFQELKQSGITLMVSSHILSELEQYADELLIMKEGTIAYHSSSDDMEDLLTQLSLTITTPASLDEAHAALGEREAVVEAGPAEKTLIITTTGTTAEIPSIVRDLAKSIDIYEVTPTSETMKDRYLSVMSEKGGEA